MYWFFVDAPGGSAMVHRTADATFLYRSHKGIASQPKRKG
jgi:hypothetical protein